MKPSSAITTLILVAVVVVICVWATYANNGGNNPEPPYSDDITGEWNVVRTETGSFSGDSTVYTTSAGTGIATIEKVDDGFYSFTFMRETTIFVRGDNVLLGTGSHNSVHSIISIKGDTLNLIYTTEADPVNVNVIRFDRTVPNDTNLPDQTESGLPDVDESMKAYRVLRYTAEKGVEDHTYAGNTMTVVGKAGPFTYTEEKYVEDGQEYVLKYVCVNIRDNIYIAAGMYETLYTLGMMYVQNGNVYNTTFSSSGMKEIWMTAFGDKSKEEPVLDLKGRHYAGTETSYITSGGKAKKVESDVTMKVSEQIDRDVIINTETEGGPAIWCGNISKSGSEYLLNVQSYALFEGEIYSGYYICLLSKDLKTLKVFGCLCGENGSGAVFKQALSLQ